LKGRLYRVRYKETPRAVGFDLSKESDEQLIERLNTGNDFIRSTAQRLLTERMSQELATRLEHVALDDELPRRQRLHAAWALMSGESHDLGFHLQILRHKDPTFRAWGLRSIGNLRVINEGALDAIKAMAKDSSPDVKLQLAIAARKIEGLDPLPILVEVLASAGDDTLIPHIVWQNLHPLLETRSAEFLAEVKKYDLKATPSLAKIMPRVTERILAAKKP
jgi:HEAT repeat protein